MNVPEPIKATLLVSGLFECRDKDGNLLKTIEIKGEIPLKEENGDQRSE